MRLYVFPKHDGSVTFDVKVCVRKYGLLVMNQILDLCILGDVNGIMPNVGNRNNYLFVNHFSENSGNCFDLFHICIFS